MITAIVIFLVIVAAMYASSSGDSTSMWIIIGVGVLVVFGIFVSHEDDKAYVNRMHYWAMSGKDRAKARNRWEAEARAEERQEREQQLERAQIALERQEIRQQKEYQKLANKLGIDLEKAPLPLLKEQICSKCRVELRVANWKRFSDGTTYVEYVCPGCGQQTTMNIGYVPLADPEKNHEEHMAYLRGRQQAYKEKQRRESERNGYCGNGVFVCHRCGRKVEARWDRVELQDGPMIMFDCPYCRTKNFTKLGGA